MTPNPTSAPAPQEHEYPRPARPVAAFYTKFRNDHAIKDGDHLTFHQWLDFADAWASTRTLRLADEATLEADSGDTIRRNESWIWLRFAAWLREKAQ